MMRIKTLVALYFWILEFDDVTCIRSIKNMLSVSSFCGVTVPVCHGYCILPPRIAGFTSVQCLGSL